MDKQTDKFFSLLQKLRFGGVVLLLALILLFAAAFLRPGGEVTDVAREGELVSAKCELQQTMRFSRCMHQVTRRVPATQASIGLDREGMEKLYDEWQLQTFSEDEITMARDIALFCPLHYVVSANESGGLSLCQNRYGDSMAWLEDISDRKMSDYDAETQEKLLMGIGFDSREEALAAVQTGLR